MIIYFNNLGVVQGMITGIRGLCNGLGPALYGFIFYIFHVELKELPMTGTDLGANTSPQHHSEQVICHSCHTNIGHVAGLKNDRWFLVRKAIMWHILDQLKHLKNKDWGTVLLYTPLWNWLCILFFPQELKYSNLSHYTIGIGNNWLSVLPVSPETPVTDESPGQARPQLLPSPFVHWFAALPLWQRKMLMANIVSANTDCLLISFLI